MKLADYADESPNNEVDDGRPGRFGRIQAQRRVLIILSVLAFAGCFGSPIIMLVVAPGRESVPEPPAPDTVRIDDASRLNATEVFQHVQLPTSTAGAASMARDALADAIENGIPVSIAGGRNSMGGQTLNPGGVLLDLSAVDRIEIDLDSDEVMASPGTRWIELIEFLDERRRSPAAVPSDATLTVGGTLGANCHGWQANTPPIASTVRDMDVLTADGSIRFCSPTADSELFRFVLGGYGLAGAIVRTTLRVQANELYTLDRFVVDAGELSALFDREVRARDDVGLAFARMCPDPDRLLEQAIVYVFRKQPARLAELPVLSEPGLVHLERQAFEAAGDPAGRGARWDVLVAVDTHKRRTFSRNRILLDGIEFIERTRGPITSIYHEYFIPVGALGSFLDKARGILRRSAAPLRRLTVRHTLTDEITMLRYADQEMYSLMLLFDQPLNDSSAEPAMEALSRQLIDAAIESGGRFSLSFRPHATLEQFRVAYPNAEAFFSAQQRLDEHGVFSNQFSRRYRSEPSAGPGGLR